MSKIGTVIILKDFNEIIFGDEYKDQQEKSNLIMKANRRTVWYSQHKLGHKYAVMLCKNQRLTEVYKSLC